MRIVTMKVAICIHCGKKGFRVPDMVRHELCCAKNPDNFHPCFGCKFLTKAQPERTGFYCKAKETRLHKRTAIYRGLDARYPKTFEKSLEMPLKCDLWEGELKPKAIKL